LKSNVTKIIPKGDLRGIMQKLTIYPTVIEKEKFKSILYQLFQGFRFTLL